MNIHWLWVLGGILSVVTSAQARQPAPIMVDSGFTGALINAQVAVFEEPPGRFFSADSVMRLPDSAFARISSKTFLFGLTETSRWLRFDIVNSAPYGRNLLLEIANPNLRHIEVFQYWNGLIIEQDSAGIDFPFHQRPAALQNFAFPVRMKGLDTITCLVHVAPAYQPANFDLYLWQRNHRITEQDLRESMAWGGFFLVHLIFLLFLGVVAGSFQLRELWYYAVYVFLGAFFVFSDIGLGYRFLWSDAPYIQKVASFVLANLYTIFGTQFIRSYFSTPRRHPYFDHVFFAAIAVSVSFLLFVLFVPLLPLRFVHLLNILQYALFLVCSISFVALFLRTLKVRMRLWSAWFLLGFSLHGAGIVITLLQYMRLLPNYSLSAWLYEMGFPLTFNTQTLMMAGMIMEIPIVIYIAFARFRYLMRQNQIQAAKLAELREKSMNDLLLGMESERRRLSQDLHDGLSVNLAAMKMKANLMEMRSQGKEKTAWRELMSDLGNAYEELRRISHNLPPKSLFRSGLHGALEEIIQRARTLRPEMNILYVNNLPLLRLSKQAEVNLFRITLELFNNALKHAEATQLSIQWLHHEEEAVLTVEDNGKGFAPDKVAGDGIGMANVRNRAALLSGEVVVDSSPGHGATIVVRVPNHAIFAEQEEVPKTERPGVLPFF